MIDINFKDEGISSFNINGSMDEILKEIALIGYGIGKSVPREDKIFFATAYLAGLLDDEEKIESLGINYSQLKDDMGEPLKS